MVWRDPGIFKRGLEGVPCNRLENLKFIDDCEILLLLNIYREFMTHTANSSPTAFLKILLSGTLQ